MNHSRSSAGSRRDIVILFALVIFLTWHPFFTRGEIKIFEMGLYLPGINAILHGAVPYRDFFHLRGPFELYVPAALMAVFGAQLSWLYFYFYAGTVATFLAAILLAREILRTRVMLYVMTIVLVARTFPRVFYHHWGGLRFAWGLLAMWCAVRFFRSGRMGWAFASGVLTACGFFTSLEIGIFSLAGFGAGLVWLGVFRVWDRRILLKAAGWYGAGAGLIAGPYLFYLFQAGALWPFIDAMSAVVSQMRVVFDQHAIDPAPRNIVEALGTMLNPFSKNFRHITPAYLYLTLLGYLLWRAWSKKVSPRDTALAVVGCYGFLLYNTSFRTVWGPQFEMALQPEKILLFFVFERAYIFLSERRRQIQTVWSGGARPMARRDAAQVWGIRVVIAVFIIGSLSYAGSRISRRFWVGQAARAVLSGKPVPMGERQDIRPVNLARTSGIFATIKEADELESVITVVQKLTAEGETVFMFPDLGAYSFFADRPFVGRFPMINLSWFSPRWHEEVLRDLHQQKPRWVVMPIELSELSKKAYFSLQANTDKYNDVMSLVEAEYRLYQMTPMSRIFIRKE